MKAKLEASLLAIVLILDIYLVSNVNVGKYNSKRLESSTANHIDVTELKKEEVIIEEKIYEDMTLNELSVKLNKILNSTITNQGYLIASYSLEQGVDPYIAVAIMLHETGCRNDCSHLVKQCNNVGGQKGSGCGSYSYFNSLEDGIKAFIDNLRRNYIDYGLNTPELMNSKYAEDTTWANYVNKYIEIIKAQ